MKKKLLISFVSLVATLSSAAQTVPLDTLTARFNKYRNTFLTEKVYAHLDRTFYLTGETLWFKLYTVDGTLHHPLDMSKVAYVEILTDAGVPVLQAKIDLENSRGHGSFYLPASLNSGNYQFRAYTSWMKNFPVEFYHNQVISVVNPFFAPENTDKKVSPGCAAEFFPEGGNLVAGIESKVAFRVSDASGRGSVCKGIILDSNGDTVTSFSPGKFGLGHFTMIPQAGVRYRAVLTGGSDVPLPQTLLSGYVMHLRDSSDGVRITIKTKAVSDDHVYLFAHARQIILKAEVRALRNNHTEFYVNNEDLAEGITHFTVFNARLEPVCERLYFIRPRRKLDINLTVSQKKFTPRKKVSISLEASNNGRPIDANLSMSVYRIDSLSSAGSAGILPYLWLTSDLAKSVESPGHYFNNRTEEMRGEVDVLMLTHGWRRFDWQDVIGTKQPSAFLPEVREHIVTAIITENGQKKRGVFTYLGSPGKIVRAYGAWTDIKGQARFEIKDFYGPRRIIVQTDTDSSETYEIKIVDPFSPVKSIEEIPPLLLKETMRGAIESRSISMQVQDIYYYEDYGRKTQIPVVDSTAFYGHADPTYLLDDYTRFPLMEEVMREYVPGVFVRKRKDGFNFLVADHVSGGILPGEPIVLLDGVPVPDVDDIMRVDPLKVKKLEVVKRPYYLGQAVFSGIVSYSTYQGDLGGLELDPRSISVDYDGLQLKRIFHKPEYTREQNNDRMPDQRSLLHWEPDITTGDKGIHQLEFYTSDVTGRYLIVVEGLTDNGLSGTATQTFEVTPLDSQ